MRPLTIAVLGGGNGSYAAAANIRLWRRDAKQFTPALTTQNNCLRDYRDVREAALD